eukprot:TRINITY_DN19226_c2_g1_i1.p1 TRINITY_DN19226_c2_g1~~TRINITY_DN19226_c2_g1_i1.p1  ORF type:complete len:711 (+),score=100.74 TRINITY_DN19226_c2_g1_i1:65-2197(+)
MACFKAIDIRFRHKDDETSFVKSLEKHLLQNTLVATVLFVMGSAQRAVSLYTQEVARTDGKHFAWGAGDAREEYFMFMLCATLAVLLLGLGVAIQLLTGRLRLPWEKIVVLDLCLTVLQVSYSTKLLLDRSWLQTETRPFTELQSMLIIDCIITASCLYLPVRCCILWLVQFCAVGGYFACVNLAVGMDTSTLLPYFVLCCLCLFSLAGAFRNERYVRSEFLAQKEVVELSAWGKGMETVAETLCDVVIKVSPDVHIIGAGVRSASMFGCSIEGRLFTDLLTEADKPRFASTLNLASETGLPTCSHVTLKREPLQEATTETFEAQLLLVHTKGSAFRYLIGVQLDRGELQDVPESSGTKVLSADDFSLLRDTSAELAASEHGFEQARSISATEHIFHTAASSNLSDIFDLGLQEHWLIRPDVLSFEQSCRVGAGGFGEIVTARFHGATVAVKTHRSTSEDTAAEIRHGLLELRMLRLLRHPNIVEFLGATIDTNTRTTKLVFEYIEAGITADHLADSMDYTGRMPAASRVILLAVLKDVSGGLSYMHSLTQPVAHRDIKGKNVLVELQHDAVQAKICDFGLSHQVGREAHGGTTRYMAPETLLKSSVTPAVDIFALGRLLFRMATGQHPLEDMDRSSLKEAAKNGLVPSMAWPVEVPLPRCRELSEACTQFAPEKRPCIKHVLEVLSQLVDEARLEQKEEVEDTRASVSL